MKYDPAPPISRVDALLAFKSDDVKVICGALVRMVFHEDDWQWAQDRCLEMVDHPAGDVKLVAVTCLGHVARIHGTLDIGRVLPVLRSLSTQTRFVGRVGDAMDDIRRFVDPNASL